MTTTRILIVEDETIVAMDIAATLRRLGYDVVATVGTGAGAVEGARAAKPDLILMDIRLRGPMDGIDAATIIQKELGIPIIFLTAHADIDTVERAKSASPHGYLVKPFDEPTLHRIVEIARQRILTDEMARQLALDTLWQSEERFRLLVNAVKEYALVLIDLNGHIVSWNSGAERMTGFTEADVLGKPLDFLRPADSEDIDFRFEQVRREGGAEWDDVGVRKDGVHYLAHVYCAPLYDRKGELVGYVSVTRDTTEQRRIEAQLNQAQKLEALGQLAGGIAHDFNNMLMVIFARCDLLLRVAESEKQRQYINDIRMAARKNRDLTQQLLGAARKQLLDPQVVSLNEVIASAIQLLAPTLGEHIMIQRYLQDDLWNVRADPGKLHQVLLNLSINARDAMTGGGALTIESRNVRVDASYARQHIGLREGDYVSLIVSDTGSGIPMEIRDRIYDPFFTTKEAGTGTGLGLAVVRGIVEQTGGQIWMYSEEGRGTTFKIFLPRHTGSVTPEANVDEALPARGIETILLVEDEDLLRAVLREAMEEHGYYVLEARGPEQALEISASFSEPIHLLLTDVIMPGMTGVALAARIHAQRPATRIIFMSGYSNQAVTNHTNLPDGVRYLEKPIATAQLLRTIGTVLTEA